MVIVCHGRDSKCRVYDKLHIGKIYEYFYHATQKCTKTFPLLSLFSLVLENLFNISSTHRKMPSSLNWPWSLPGSMIFDHGQFQMITCSYESWPFICMITALTALPDSTANVHAESPSQPSSLTCGTDRTWSTDHESLKSRKCGLPIQSPR